MPKIYWRKMKIKKKEWDDWYSRLSYTNLGESYPGVIEIGFLTADNDDDRFELCTESDLMRIQRHREANNWFPQPMFKTS
jgi:hypothetical protein